MIVAIDGPAGAGKSTVAAYARDPARLSLPRHGRDVPGAHVARARGGPRRSTTAPRSATLRSVSRSSFEGDRVFIRGRGCDGGDPQAAHRPRRLLGRASPGGARGHAGAPARARLAHGDAVIEGRDIGTVVCPTADVKVYLVADAGERARRRDGRPARDRRGGARHRPPPPRRARRRADAAGAGRAADRHDRARPSTRSSTGSSSSSSRGRTREHPPGPLAGLLGDRQGAHRQRSRAR